MRTVRGMCNQEELLQKMVGHRKANTKIKKVITSTGTIVLLFRDSEKAQFEFLRTWVCFLSGFQKRKLWGTRAQPKFVLSYVHDAFFSFYNRRIQTKHYSLWQSQKIPTLGNFCFAWLTRAQVKSQKSATQLLLN
jgi:hypothetical protein